MELEFDPEFIEWFSESSRALEWDEGNIRKNEKHFITYKEIEEIFESPIYVAGKILLSPSEESRWLMLGEANNKGWSLIVTRRREKLRVISCRRQRKKEAQFYESLKEEN